MKTIHQLFSGTITTILLWTLASVGLAAPRQPQPPWPEATLRIYSFDSPYWLVPWNELALYEEQAGLKEGWSGYSLVRDGFVTTPVVIPFEPDAKRPSFATGTGAVRFWISTSWSTASKETGGSGPGRWARLVELVSLNGKTPEVKWSLHLNETGDTIYLSGAGLAGAKQYLQAPVTFAAGDWRLITLCYSPTNTQLQIDTQVVATGDGLPALAWWETNALGLVIGSDVLASPESLAGAEFEEVTTLPRWPRKADWQELYYLSGKRRSLLGPVGTKEEEQTKMALLKGAGLLPESYGEAQRFEEGDGPIAYSYAPESLWLEITGVSNHLAYVTVHGTVADVAYEILSKVALTNSEWTGEQVVVGASGQDWTPTTEGIGTRTNELFFWARTLVDSDGDGLPDWWELAHGLDPNNADTGGTGVSDGYKDGDNDGWTNLQEYQNGTNPGSFNTPAAPQGFSISYRIANGQVEFNWQAVLGPVTGYSIRFEDPVNNNYQTFNLSPVSTSYTNYYSSTNLNVEYWPPECWIQAHYPGGDSEWSEGVLLLDEATMPNAFVVRGPQGGSYLKVSALPENTASLLLSRVEAVNDQRFVTEFVVELTNLVNGTFLLPENWMTPLTIGSSSFDNPYKYYNWYLQTVTATGLRSLEMQPVSGGWWRKTIPFFDGRAQLKQNLSFLLRAATPNVSFGYYYDEPQQSASFIGSPASYAYASFIEPENYSGTYDISTREFHPFDEHYRYRNFVYDVNRLGIAGDLQTGLTWEYPQDAPTLWYPATNQFSFPTNLVTFPTLLDDSDTRWLYWQEFHPWSEQSWDEIGITYQTPDYVMATGYRNLFGLPYLSAKLAWGSTITDTATLNAGGSVPADLGYFYPETEAPAFQSDGYYFAPVREHELSDVPLPGHTAFNPTNTSPLLIASVGDPNFQVAGYAKLAVTNGYTGVYGYLGQYFDKALKMTNGVVTTNETGILSPYGEFFPTQPGMTALVTMPDLDTNERGTAIVHVVKLQLDVNHDGEMDLSFAGPDNTSANRPFTFWVNNDHDVTKSIGDWGQDDEATHSYLYDYNFLTIRSVRNLEDFSRLWICGIPALATNAGYQVTLSWNVTSGNPAINLYRAVETDGGTDYLTDTNTALAQIASPNPAAPGWIFGSINAAAPLTFPGHYFTDGSTRYLLFEGAGIGTGELVLTISQNATNVLARTSARLDLRDVKDLYERVVVTNTTTGGITNWSSAIHTIESAKVSMDDDTNIIVFVHGINNTVPDWLISSDTIFKRLYWSGYRGKFATVNWPCKFLPPRTHPFDFNLSEFYGYKSGAALRDYLNQLRQVRFPNHRLHIYAHSQGGAVASDAISQYGAPFDSLVLSQAALPASCYDPQAPTLQKLLDAESLEPTPEWKLMGYRGIYTNITGRVVNFYNPADYALATGTVLYGILQANWEENERLTKPDGLPGARNYTSDGTNGYADLIGAPPRLVTDSQECRGMVSRSRTKAVGTLTGVGGVVDFSRSANLQTAFGFHDTREEHSAQFTRPIQTVLSYYITLLGSIAP